MDDFWEKFLAWVFGIFLTVGIIAIPCLIYSAHQKHENVIMPAAYEAWSKHTGNPGKLTYQEWRHLRSSGAMDDDE